MDSEPVFHQQGNLRAEVQIGAFHNDYRAPFINSSITNNSECAWDSITWRFDSLVRSADEEWQINDFHCYAVKDIPRGHHLRPLEKNTKLAAEIDNVFCITMTAKGADSCVRFIWSDLISGAIQNTARLLFESHDRRHNIRLWFRPDPPEKLGSNSLPAIYSILSHRKAPLQDFRDSAGIPWYNPETLERLHNPVRYFTDNEEEMRRERHRLAETKKFIHGLLEGGPETVED